MSRSFTRVKAYTTDVSVGQTISEIERMLTTSGANKILKEYNEAGEPIGLSFIINTDHGPMPVKMPVRVEKVLEVFRLQVGKKLLERRYLGGPGSWAEAQAKRVGWRILRDWLDAQLALINVEMSSLTEIFLPYVYSEKLGKTVHDVFASGGFDRMLGAGGESFQVTVVEEGR